MLKAVLFDLDGTLLPMDMDTFTNGYFKMLMKKAFPYGYEPDKLIKTIWKGIKAMVQNDGSESNETAFWNYFASVYGEDKLKDKEMFDAFYANEFKAANVFCGFNPKAAEVVHFLRERGIRTILATNPIFPAVATKIRMGWAGLDENDFEFFTAYENSTHAKPNPVYYEDVLRQADLSADEVIMVGNDAIEDLAAQKFGINVFLLTDCLINEKNADISSVPQGGFDELKKYLEALI